MTNVVDDATSSTREPYRPGSSRTIPRKRIEYFHAHSSQLEGGLQQLDTKIERALDLAIELGDLAAAKERLATLREERGRAAPDLARARAHLPTLEELMPVVRAKLEKIEQTLLADVAQGRMALGALHRGIHHLLVRLRFSS